jgi:hypothetical protein
MEKANNSIPDQDLIFRTADESIKVREEATRNYQKEKQANQKKRGEAISQITQTINESTVIQAFLDAKKKQREDIITSLCGLDEMEPNYERQLMILVQKLKNIQGDINTFDTTKIVKPKTEAD